MPVNLSLILLDTGSSLDGPANVLTIVTGVISVITSAVAVIVFIRNGKLAGLTRQIRRLNPNLQVLKDYDMVWNKIGEIMYAERKDGNPILLKNIGLDLEKILPDISDFLEKTFEAGKKMHFTYNGLILNPDSTFISPLINGPSNIRTQYVKGSYERLHYMNEKVKVHPEIQLDVRSYDFPPSLHGMLVNEKHLFLGFTEMKDGKLYGSDRPYLYLRYASNVPTTEHYFNFFRNWFDYYWNYGR